MERNNHSFFLCKEREVSNNMRIPTKNLYIDFRDLVCDYDEMERRKNRVKESELLRIQEEYPDMDTSSGLDKFRQETNRDPDYFYHRTPNDAVLDMINEMTVNVCPILFRHPVNALERASIDFFCEDFLKHPRPFTELQAIDEINEDDILLTTNPILYEERAKEGKFTVFLRNDNTKALPIGMSGLVLNPGSPHAAQYLEVAYRDFQREREEEQELVAER